MVMTYSEKDRVTAIAGLFQSASLVNQLATTGHVSDTVFSHYTNSLFSLNSGNISDIYVEKNAYRAGLITLKNVLERQASMGQHYVLRYALCLIQLEKNLQRNPTMQNFIRQRIKQVARQKIHFAHTYSENCLLNSTIISSIASIYKESLSTLRPQIQVIGHSRYLQTETIANKIRMLLLAGIRAALLWKQMGGRRWHLIFLRNRMLRTINHHFNTAD